MKKLIVILRLLALVFLVGVTYSVTLSPGASSWELAFIRLSMQFSLAFGSEEIILSSTLAGYLLSLVATRLSVKYTGRQSEFQWSMILAVMGAASLSNEFLRLLHDHVQVLMIFPLLQVIVDALALRFVLRHNPEAEQPTH